MARWECAHGYIYATAACFSLLGVVWECRQDATIREGERSLFSLLTGLVVGNRVGVPLCGCMIVGR